MTALGIVASAHEEVAAGPTISVASFTQTPTWMSETTPQNITAQSWSSGDMVVVLTALADSNGSTSSATPTNANLSFTLQTTSTGSNESVVKIFTAIAGSSQTGQTIATARTNGTPGAGQFGVGVWVITGGPSGVANAVNNRNETATSLTVSASSIVIHGMGDWNSNTTARTATTGSGTSTQRVDSRPGSYWSMNGFEWVGTAAGTFSFGITSYASIKASNAFIEVLN